MVLGRLACPVDACFVPFSDQRLHQSARRRCLAGRNTRPSGGKAPLPGHLVSIRASARTSFSHHLPDRDPYVGPRPGNRVDDEPGGTSDDLLLSIAICPIPVGASRLFACFIHGAGRVARSLHPHVSSIRKRLPSIALLAGEGGEQP